LQQALEFFINLDSRSAQYLSLYIDDMLKTKIKGVPEHEIDKRLNEVRLRAAALDWPLPANSLRCARSRVHAVCDWALRR
jgi:hypothetical protein